jgi:polyhydroxybutyrate depolymerase
VRPNLLATISLVLGLACCAAAGDLERRTLHHGGLERVFHLHAPEGATPTARPLVIVLHGGHGKATGMPKLTRGGFERLADREGFLVCYPEAVEGNWNDGRGVEEYRAQLERIDDVGFLATLIDALVAEGRVDPRRVFVTGISNGAMMSNRLGLELPAKIAAIAPVAGSIPVAIAPTATASPAAPSVTAVAVLMINGDADPLVPYEGGEVHFYRRKLGKVVSAPAAARIWAARNGCAPAPEASMLDDRDPADGTRVRRERWAGAAEVVLLTVEGGGHTWPGGLQYLPELVIGRTTRDIDGCAEIWRFFEAHGR